MILPRALLGDLNKEHKFHDCAAPAGPDHLEQNSSLNPPPITEQAPKTPVEALVVATPRSPTPTPTPPKVRKFRTVPRLPIQFRMVPRLPYPKVLPSQFRMVPRPRYPKVLPSQFRMVPRLPRPSQFRMVPRLPLPS